MESIPKRTIQPLPGASFYHLFWPSQPPDSLKITQVAEINPFTTKINIEVIVLESWSIQQQGISNTLYCLHVADDSGSCFVNSWEVDVISLVAGDIIRVISGTPQLYAGKLTVKAGVGSKLERIGSFALLYNEEPNISLYTWKNERGELLQTSTKTKTINFQHGEKITLEKSKSYLSIDIKRVPPSKRSIVAKTQMDEKEKRKLELLHSDHSSESSSYQLLPPPSHLGHT